MRIIECEAEENSKFPDKLHVIQINDYYQVVEPVTRIGLVRDGLFRQEEMAHSFAHGFLDCMRVYGEGKVDRGFSMTADGSEAYEAYLAGVNCAKAACDAYVKKQKDKYPIFNVFNTTNEIKEYD